MSRKKKHEHVNHERWLVSYADFITLLFAFFVVLFASSQSDKKKQAAMMQAMQNAFQQYGVFEAHSKTPALAPSAGSSEQPAPIATHLSLEIAASDEAIRKQIAESIARELRQGSGKLLAKGVVNIRNAADGMVISLKDVGFFDSGSAKIRPEALQLLQHIASDLPPGNVRVEGHTDNVAIHSAQYDSNWELSTARATAIARVLLERSFVNPAALSIAGYGEFHPIAPNSTADGRAMNRRVDIVLLRPAHMTEDAQPGRSQIAEVETSSRQVPLP